jgi:hypothetical protein
MSRDCCRGTTRTNPGTILFAALAAGSDGGSSSISSRMSRALCRHDADRFAAGGAPVELEFACTVSAQAKLLLTAHEVYLPKPKLAV